MAASQVIVNAYENERFKMSYCVESKLPAAVVGIFTVFILLPITCIALAPINDTCNGAIVLTNGVPYTSNTAGANTNGDTQGAGCVVIDQGVWFAYTPAADGVVLVDTCGSSFQTALAVFTNSCGSLGRLTCGDYDSGFCVNRQTAVFSGKAGSTYHILTGGDSRVIGGSGTLRITVTGVRVPNDECAGAIALTNTLAYVMSTTNATATNDTQGLSCDYVDKGVWFTYAPTADGVLVVDTCGSSFVTALTVFTNSCGALGRLACGYFDNGFCGNKQVATFVGKAGMTYTILAGGDYTGSGTLRITACLGPRFVSEVVSGTNLSLSGTCGTAGSNYYVLASTNVGLPLSNWTRLLTNKFTANGNFIFTNAIKPGEPHRFFVIQVP